MTSSARFSLSNQRSSRKGFLCIWVCSADPYPRVDFWEIGEVCYGINRVLHRFDRCHLIRWSTILPHRVLLISLVRSEWSAIPHTDQLTPDRLRGRLGISHLRHLCQLKPRTNNSILLQIHSCLTVFIPSCRTIHAILTLCYEKKCAELYVTRKSVRSFNWNLAIFNLWSTKAMNMEMQVIQMIHKGLVPWIGDFVNGTMRL